MLDTVPRPFLILGIAGLLPFWGLAILLWFLSGPMLDTALQAQIAYGAVILTFLGGVHWGIALGQPDHASPLRLCWGVTPSLIGWIAVLLSPGWGLLLLAVSLALAAIIDRRGIAALEGLAWYGKLRTVLSTGAVSALGVSLLSL
ncbi:MAG: DUF3429 domain-containing protein [Rhodospirillaceae bacterium]